MFTNVDELPMGKILTVDQMGKSRRQSSMKPKRLISSLFTKMPKKPKIEEEKPEY